MSNRIPDLPHSSRTSNHWVGSSREYVVRLSSLGFLSRDSIYTGFFRLGRSLDVGVHMLHELRCLTEGHAADLALLGSMLFLVCFKLPGAGEWGWAVSVSEDYHDTGVTNSVDMLLVLLKVLWNSQLTPCYLYSPWQQAVRIRATEVSKE